MNPFWYDEQMKAAKQAKAKPEPFKPAGPATKPHVDKAKPAARKTLKGR